MSDLPDCDITKYRAEISELELSQEQQTEFLNLLWNIMSTFVDLGFGVDSVQTLLPGLSELDPDLENDAKQSPKSIENRTKKSFNELSHEHQTEEV